MHSPQPFLHTPLPLIDHGCITPIQKVYNYEREGIYLSIYIRKNEMSLSTETKCPERKFREDSILTYMS